MRVVLVVLLLAGCAAPAEDKDLGLLPPEPLRCGANVEQTDAGYSILMDNFKTRVNTTIDAEFVWTIRGPGASAAGSADQSNLVWGFNSVNLCQALGGYTTSETGINGTVNLPHEHRFSVLIEVPGTYYARAHTQVGDVHIFTPEVTFVVEE